MNLIKYKGYMGTVEYSPEDKVLFGKATSKNGFRWVAALERSLSPERSRGDEQSSSHEMAVKAPLAAQNREYLGKGSYL